MGSESFFITKKGQYKNAEEAFIEAVKEAEYEYGHQRYTGSIAEKDSFRMLEVPPKVDQRVFAEEASENSGDKFWDDKWEPAACVEVIGKQLQNARGEKWKGKRNFHVYYFFGWASC